VVPLRTSSVSLFLIGLHSTWPTFPAGRDFPFCDVMIGAAPDGTPVDA